MKRLLITCVILLGALSALLVGEPKRALEASSRLPATSASATTAYHAALIFTKPGMLPAEDAWLLVANGKVSGIALSADELPPLVQVVELGEQVIIPGLVAADSGLSGNSGQNDYALGAHHYAIDNFDAWQDWSSIVRRGITTTYLAPARARLIGGRGAVVKTAGNNRVLAAQSDLRVNLTEEISATDPFFRPPVPPTAENPLRSTDVQAASSTAGALMVLREQTVYQSEDGFAPDSHTVLHGAEMRAFLADNNSQLRVVANTAGEIFGAMEIAALWGKQLVLQGGEQLNLTTTDIIRFQELSQACGVQYVLELPLFLNMPNLTDDWEAPNFDAIHPSLFSLVPGNHGRWTWLLEAARAGVGLGMDSQQALAAITSNPAHRLGVGSQVGSLLPGYDADFVAMSATPLDAAARVNRVWIDGEQVWDDHQASGMVGGTVVRAGTVWTGEGNPLQGGAEVLMQAGKIVAVGHQVPHPAGARIVDAGADAHITAGFIDAAGNLGVSGNSRPDPAVTLGLLAAGSRWNSNWSRVAKAGVTTMVLKPSGTSSSGIRTQAVKTAAAVDDAFIEDHDIVFFNWSGGDHLANSSALRGKLVKGKKYADQWVKWREDYAKWETENAAKLTKQRETAEAELRKRLATGAATEKEEQAEDEEEQVEEEEKKASKVDPINGLWEATIEHEMLPEPVNVNLRVSHEGPRVVILISSPDFPGEQAEEIEGEWDGKNIHIELPTEMGTVEINGELDSPDHMNISVVLMGLGSVEFEAFRVEIGEAGQVVTSSKKREKKDAGPAEPSKDWKQEGLRALFEGRATAVVRVDRADEIQTAINAFSEFKLPFHIANATDADSLSGQLAKQGVGVVLNLGLSRSDGRDYSIASDLHRMGVATCFKTGASGGARFMPQVLTSAVSNGLGAEQALASVTWQAADMLGLEHRVGRLRAGLDGDLVIHSGPPFKQSTKVDSVWVNGGEVTE